MANIENITAENWETALLLNHGVSADLYLPEDYENLPESDAWELAVEAAETLAEKLGTPELRYLIEEQLFERWTNYSEDG